MIIAFTVHGQPKPWARPRVNGKRFFNDPDVEAYKARVHDHAIKAKREFEKRFVKWPSEAIYEVVAVVHRIDWDRFDCDRMLNTACDALVGVLYQDDRQKYVRDARVLVGDPSVEPYLSVLVHAYDNNEHQDKVVAMERTIETVGWGML